MARVVIVALLALVVATLVRWIVELDPRARRRVLGWIGALVFAGVIVLLVRLGMHWLAVAGTALLGVAKKLGPVALRLLAAAPRLWQRYAWARSGGPGVHGTSGTGDSSRHEASPGGQSSSAGSSRPRAGAMSPEEAREVLGVEEGASREQILTAYKHLIRKVHPDTPGGSNYLASKLNQAKQTLLG